jgi:dTDP-4-dehydrorhamnose 3,5-epimerase
MDVTPLKLPEVPEIIPRKLGDERGFFSETYSLEVFGRAGIDLIWVQDNHSFSVSKGVLRGLHYQSPPMAQDKLVRVVKGAMFNVAVDIRHGSPSFGQWVSLIVSEEAWNQILIPKGFAHGFLTFEPNTEVIYKVSAFYSAAHDRNIRFDDRAIGIDWPISDVSPVLSEKDRNAPMLRDADTGFRYEGDSAR